jgi:tryptophan synthase beta chain
MMPFLPRKLDNPEGFRWVAAEADTAPRLTRGEWRYDHADPLGITPLTMSYTLGRDYVLPETHVGGLRQHSGSTIVGLLRRHGLLEAHAYSEHEVFQAGRLLIRLEGIVPAPESCHALKATIDCALEAKRRRHATTIVMCLSGNGSLDLGGYIDVLGIN